VKFLEHKTLNEDCSDIRKCVERLIRKRGIASLFYPVLVTYVAREMGTVDVGKIICFLDELTMSGVLAIFLRMEIHFWIDSTT
jgi:hypothetical protein